MGARALVAAIALLWATPAGAGLQTAIGGLGDGEQTNLGRTCRNFFRVLPYLTQVTATTIRSNVVPETSFDLRWSVSLATDAAWGVRGIVVQNGATTDVRTHGVAAPAHTFTGLTAGTDYKYQVECRANASSPYQLVQRAFFRTLETSAAAVVRVAVTADSHVGGVLGHLFNNPDQVVNPAEIEGYWSALLDRVRYHSVHYLVDLGDTQTTHCPGCEEITYNRESGDSTVVEAGTVTNQTQADLRWELFLVAWQPLLAYYPFFEALGNHEGAHGVLFNSAGHSAALHALSVTAYTSMLGNYSDAYPADTGDMDGDTVAEVQADGLYYEFASGSLRWFIIDPGAYAYGADLVGAAAPATLFPGFVARTAAIPDATAPVTWPEDNTDTWEDNATLGGEQTGWLVARMAAFTEAFGVVASHRIIGGFPAFPMSYYYQRGSIATKVDAGTGRRLVTGPWDGDGDGDVSDEKYIADLMITNGAQIRFNGHDHTHVICRKDGVHHIAVGTPDCYATGGGKCPGAWDTGTDVTGGSGAATDSYDCDESGFADMHNDNSDLGIQNGGINGVNGTTMAGFGILTANGATSMRWQWVGLSDPRWGGPTAQTSLQAPFHGQVVIDYGPINP